MRIIKKALQGEKQSKNSEQVGELSDYAVQTRYPGDYVEIGEDEYKKVIELAERIYHWAEKEAYGVPDKIHDN